MHRDSQRSEASPSTRSGGLAAAWSLVLALFAGCGGDSGDSGGGDGDTDTDATSGGTTTGSASATGSGTTSASTTTSASEGSSSATTATSDTGSTGASTLDDSGGSTADATGGSTDPTGSESATTGGVCEDMACGGCYACALDDPSYCSAEKDACDNDADCTALAECVASCGPADDPDFETCHDTCVDGMSGEDPFKALGACLACDTCGCMGHPEC